jgi:hypothetical protein
MPGGKDVWFASSGVKRYQRSGPHSSEGIWQMFTEKSKKVLLQIISVAIFSTGLVQASHAGAISTSYMVDVDNRSASLDRIQVLLAQDSVAEQLQKFGVEQSAIEERLQGMTTAELVSLEGRLQTEIAGGSAVGIIGAVFLVLIILELVGVIDIFKAF